MPERFESKVVVVTGGTSGSAGRSPPGWRPRSWPWRSARAAATGGEEVAEGIRAAGGRALFAATDVTVESRVAALVAHLLSDEAAFVNGAAVRIDGGFTAGSGERWAARVLLAAAGFTLAAWWRAHARRHGTSPRRRRRPARTAP